MVDESVDITQRFPIPARGVPVICSMNFDVEAPIPLIYFGRETRNGQKTIPESPELLRGAGSSGGRSASNPLSSIIRKWETQFALQGAAMESSGLDKKGRNADDYNLEDEWLDDGEDEQGDSGEYIGEVDLDSFRAIDPREDAGLGDDSDDVESDGTDQEEEDDVDVGGNWQLLLKRLDSTKQPLVKELVIELETFQAFPGHTKPKKQKQLRDSIARLRRLLPKVNHTQSQWQAAVWNVVVATNEGINMQAFLELWNDLAPSKQKEDILAERNELIEKLKDSIGDVVTAYQKNEALVRSKHDTAFNTLSKIWDLWVQEEECAGRVKPPLIPGIYASKIEKRFGSTLCELVPQLPIEAAPLFLRVAMFGHKKSSLQQKKNTASSSNSLPEASEEETQVAGGDEANPSSSSEVPIAVNLPINVFIYRKNELLKCKLLEVKSLSHQHIQIIDKEWDGAGGPDGSLPEFNSFESLFESYQQKYVRKQDRVDLASSLDAWKMFAIRNPKNPSVYITLYDLAQKASSVLHYAFYDKSGYPVFLPSLAVARSLEVEKRKKTEEQKEEKKRKREAQDMARSKEASMRHPPFNSIFLPIPEFNKELFSIIRNMEVDEKDGILDIAPDETASQMAPVIASPNEASS
jgi:hypothetical protein